MALPSWILGVSSWILGVSIYHHSEILASDYLFTFSSISSPFISGNEKLNNFKYNDDTKIEILCFSKNREGLINYLHLETNVLGAGN